MDEKNEIICYCKKVTRQEIVKALEQGAMTLAEIQNITGACTGNQCETLNPHGRCCSVEIFEILADFFGDIGTCPCCGR